MQAEEQLAVALPSVNGSVDGTCDWIRESPMLIMHLLLVLFRPNTLPSDLYTYGFFIIHRRTRAQLSNAEVCNPYLPVRYYHRT